MFRLDIDFFPLLILVPAIVQFAICLRAGKKRDFASEFFHLHFYLLRDMGTLQIRLGTSRILGYLNQTL